MRHTWIGGQLLGWLLLLATGLAHGASCSLSGDAGCLAYENWAGAIGTRPPDWSWNTSGLANATMTATPLGGAPQSLQLIGKPICLPDGQGNCNFSIAPSQNCQGCPGGTTSIGRTLTNGTRFWHKVTLFYDPGFKYVCDLNCAYKTYAINGPVGRHLLTTERNMTGGTEDEWHLRMAMYPNYGASRPAGAVDPTCPACDDPAVVGGNSKTEKDAPFGPGTTAVPMRVGVAYEIITEVLLGKNTAGAYKMWVNGTKVFDVPSIQTTLTAGSSAIGEVAIGGPHWVKVGPDGVPIPGAHTWRIGPILVTTTNLAPGPPATTIPAPSNLLTK